MCQASVKVQHLHKLNANKIHRTKLLAGFLDTLILKNMFDTSKQFISENSSKLCLGVTDLIKSSVWAYL